MPQSNRPARSERPIPSLPPDTPFPLSQRQTVTSRAAVRLIESRSPFGIRSLAEGARPAPILLMRLASKPFLNQDWVSDSTDIVEGNIELLPSEGAGLKRTHGAFIVLGVRILAISPTPRQLKPAAISHVLHLPPIGA